MRLFTKMLQKPLTIFTKALYLRFSTKSQIRFWGCPMNLIFLNISRSLWNNDFCKHLPLNTRYKLKVYDVPNVLCTFNLRLAFKELTQMPLDLALYTPTPENDQTHLRNLLATVDEFIECVWLFCGVGT